MHHINISHFKKYSIQNIKEYLSIHDDTTYVIIIPKQESDPNDKNFSIFWQYYMAAYAGQQLYNIANSFAYYIPSPDKTDPFRFELERVDSWKLSLALKYIITGYYTDGTAMTRFHESGSQYFQNAFEGKTDSNTWGLLYIANEYLNQSH